jgi:hypothetical protein
MSKIWKWILGIVLVLVLVSAMFAIGFMWRSHVTPELVRTMPMSRDGNVPMQRGQWNQQEQYQQFNHPMMNARNFSPFGGFFMLGGLVKLALFFGLVYGAYWLGKRNARIAIDPAPAAHVDAATDPVKKTNNN